MRIGIIGTAGMGSTLARNLAGLGHDVSIANSRGPSPQAFSKKGAAAGGNLPIAGGVHRIDQNRGRTPVREALDVVRLPLENAESGDRLAMSDEERRVGGEVTLRSFEIGQPAITYRRRPRLPGTGDGYSQSTRRQGDAHVCEV